MLTPASCIAIIGFGDLGRRIAVQFARRGMAVRAWDRRLEGGGQQMRDGIEAAGIDPASTLVEALRGARLVIAADSEANPGEPLRSLAALLTSGQVCLDLGDSPAPPDMAALIERSGAHYVAGQPGDPLLLAGARATALAAALDALGCPARALASLPPRVAAGDAQPVQVRDGTAGCAPLRRGELP